MAHVLRFLTVAAVVYGAAGERADAAQSAERTVRLAEASLRRTATSSPMPEYPRASLEDKVTGVAVAAVTFGIDGQARTVDVLEAPDSHIAASVRDAVLKWAVPALTVSGGPDRYGATGKLTFYFEITGGSGRVVNPELPPPAGTRTLPGSVPVVRSVEAAAGAVEEMTRAELQKLSDTARPTILDIGDRDAFRRGHQEGAVNIPVEELDLRARRELPLSGSIVIDCTQEQLFRCRAALAILRELGASKLALLVP